jgi:hypothetical protein
VGDLPSLSETLKALVSFVILAMLQVVLLVLPRQKPTGIDKKAPAYGSVSVSHRGHRLLQHMKRSIKRKHKQLYRGVLLVVALILIMSLVLPTFMMGATPTMQLPLTPTP